MLFTLMLLALSLSGHPIVASNAQIGHFVDVVGIQYDAETNTTWGVIENYNITNAGGQASVNTLQPRSFSGNVSKGSMLNSIVRDADVKPVQ